MPTCIDVNSDTKLLHPTHPWEEPMPSIQRPTSTLTHIAKTTGPQSSDTASNKESVALSRPTL